MLIIIGTERWQKINVNFQKPQWPTVPFEIIKRNEAQTSVEMKLIYVNPFCLHGYTLPWKKFHNDTLELLSFELLT